jgi:hypothetical protein
MDFNNLKYWVFSITLVTVLLFVLSSCSTVNNKESIKINKFEYKTSVLKSFNPGIKTISIKGQLTADFQNEHQSASFKILMASEDSISLTISGPFGITVAKLFSTPEKFIFLNVFGNEVYSGTPNEENLSRVINIPLSYKEFLHLIRSETPNQADNYTSQAGDVLLFRNVKPTYFSELVNIRESDSLLSGYKRINKDGSEILTVDYTSYRKYDDYSLARNIIMKFPGINSKIVLDIDEIKVNEKFEKPFSFQIPKDSKVITID